MQTVYITEDDENIRELVIYALNSNDFRAFGFETPKALFERLKSAAPDLFILDIMLPGGDGYSVLRLLKANAAYKNIPVIMLTAKSAEFDKIKGLDMGADDYITKPFGVMELISRVKAVLRRCGEGGAGYEQTVLEFKNISLDLQKRGVEAAGEPVALTYKEFELLRYLLCNRDIALSREKIMSAVWGYDFEGETRTVDMHIKSIRRKLKSAGAHIKTVRNVGYKIGE